MKILPGFIRSHLEKSSTFQKIFENISWLLLDKAVRLGLGLVVGVWVARYLGPEQFGKLNFALSFVMLFAVISTLGLDGIVVRDIVRDINSKNETIGTTFILKLIGALLTLLLSLFTMRYLRPDDSLMFAMVGVIAAKTVFQSFDVIDFWFQSLIQSKYAVWARDSAFLVIVILKVVMILSGASILAFAQVFLIEGMLVALGLISIYFAKGYSPFFWKASINRARMLLQEGWPLIFSGLLVMVYMRIDQVMLGQMVGDEAVGIFSAAVRLSEIWYFVPMIIASSIFPSLVQSKPKGISVYMNRLQQYFDLNAILAYGMALPSSLLSSHLISFLYGSSYQGAEAIFVIHIWSCIFVFLGVAREQYILNESLMKYSLVATLLGACSNILLNIFLIPLYSGVGAAIATLISQFISTYLSSFIFKPLRNIGYMQSSSIVAPFRYIYSITKL